MFLKQPGAMLERNTRAVFPPRKKAIKKQSYKMYRFILKAFIFREFFFLSTINIIEFKKNSI